jgi:hypothetical protein
VKCQDHHKLLIPENTSYGTRWRCPVETCTVVCWNGSTSTPANKETRELRHQCHEAFDPLWRDKTRFKSRKEAYLWLSKITGLPKARCHIGMFDAERCRKLLAYLKEKPCTP